jgi:hypothetical protein
MNGPGGDILNQLALVRYLTADNDPREDGERGSAQSTLPAIERRMSESLAIPWRRLRARTVRRPSGNSAV